MRINCIAFSRIEHKLNNSSKVCCIAEDIMEALGLQLPMGNGQCKFSSTIDSVFVGALAHGHGMSLYRTNNLVKKCGSLTVHDDDDGAFDHIKGACKNQACLFIDGHLTLTKIASYLYRLLMSIKSTTGKDMSLRM